MGFFKLLAAAPFFGLGFWYAREVTTKPLDFASRYGHGSWALVTGASDGIGIEYARAFADRGFNLVIIARTENKLKAVAEQLKAKHGVDVIPITADFSANVPEQVQNIATQTAGLDISVLVNNVGMVDNSKIQSVSESHLEAVINANVVTSTLMNHTYAERLLQRAQRSAIINLASFTSTFIGGRGAVYAGTKGYDQWFSLALGDELKENVDVLTVQPGLVATPMTSKYSKNVKAVSPKEHVEGALKYLGRERYAYGARSHAFQGLLINFIPWRFMTRAREAVNNKLHGAAK